MTKKLRKQTKYPQEVIDMIISGIYNSHSTAKISRDLGVPIGIINYYRLKQNAR